MNISDIYVKSGITILLVLSWFIDIPKLKINIWELIGRKIGKVLNTETSKEIESLRKEVKEDIQELREDIDKTNKSLEDYKATDTARSMDNIRQRILRFSDEIRRKERHSKESFDNILDDIDDYEHYCDAHADYKNSKAEFAIENIRKAYRRTLDQNDFLND